MELSRGKVVAAAIGVAGVAAAATLTVVLLASGGDELAFAPVSDGAQGSSPVTVQPDEEELEPLFGQEEGDEPEEEVAPPAPTGRSTTTGTRSIDEAEARERALEVTGGEVLRVRADRDDGRTEWEVRVRDDRGRDVEVTFDAETGLLTELDVAERDRPTGDRQVSEETARSQATALLGGEVLDIERESDDGRPEWELLVRDEHGRLLEVTIDAVAGEVVEVDLED